jgi:hypothetical protein
MDGSLPEMQQAYTRYSERNKCFHKVSVKFFAVSLICGLRNNWNIGLNLAKCVGDQSQSCHSVHQYRVSLKGAPAHRPPLQVAKALDVMI